MTTSPTALDERRQAAYRVMSPRGVHRVPLSDVAPVIFIGRGMGW
ncbi:MAG: hypothetical protein V3V29_01260 [Acidimicrobiia bacterium]